MLQNTPALLLRTVKFGETSLVCTFLTRTYGVQAYLLKGIRKPAAKAKGQGRAALLQPGALLDLTVYHKPGAGLQHIREFAPLHLYKTLQQDIARNCIGLFATELLLRLLPNDAPAPELYDFCLQFLVHLDREDEGNIANYPLFFTVQCSRYLGYTIGGNFSPETPYLNMQEGNYTAEPPIAMSNLVEADGAFLDRLMASRSFSAMLQIQTAGASRQRLLEWFVRYLQRHTDHMGDMRSLEVLHTVLR